MSFYFEYLHDRTRKKQKKKSVVYPTPHLSHKSSQDNRALGKWLSDPRNIIHNDVITGQRSFIRFPTGIDKLVPLSLD